jgi:hypothetical protein
MEEMKENNPTSSLKTPVVTAGPAVCDTPETDAAVLHDGTVVSVGFARKLERERNHWKEKFELATGHSSLATPT